MLEIAIGALAVTAQYGLVFGGSYLVYRYVMKRATDVKGVRVVSRFFALFACAFVFLVLLASQLVSPKSWWPVFLAPVWVAGFFVVHDVAIGLALKKRESIEQR